MPPLAFSTLMAMPSFLESDQAKAFMKAYKRALEWVNDASADEIAEKEHELFPNVSRTALAAAIKRYQRIKTWRVDPIIPRDQYEVSMDAFIHSGIFKQRFRYEDVVFDAAMRL
jgi:ABC-type nitrate/sulfonate/bicarbonate transport system substrate-binding protein